MKAYTDLQQSSKLAEILPIESADVWWAERYGGKVTHDGQYIVNEEPIYYISFIKPSEINYSQDTVKDIPCWSLAALLEVLPTIDDGNRNPVICKDIRLNKWHVVYHGTAVEPTIDSEVYDDLIDAAVEMILKLHEQKLI